MPEHPRDPDTAAVSALDGPQWIVTRAGVRAALGGRWDDLGALSAAWRLRACMPGIEATIAAEYEFRDQLADQAHRAGGLRQFVVVDPDLPPWRPVHEALPADAGCRVLYLVDDIERAVRTWLLTICQDLPRVDCTSSYPDIEMCLRTAALNRDITLDEPICVLLSPALQHTRDPEVVLSQLWNVLPAGSWVAVTQISSPAPATGAGRPALPVEIAFTSCLDSPLVLRGAAELEQLFTVPHAWELLRFGGVECLSARGAGPALPAGRASPQLLTVVARRPPRKGHPRRSPRRSEPARIQENPA
ncbi:SAM-dependent methyltransferase [Amycolatopsis sp. TRM77291]